MQADGSQTLMPPLHMRPSRVHVPLMHANPVQHWPQTPFIMPHDPHLLGPQSADVLQACAAEDRDVALLVELVCWQGSMGAEENVQDE